MKPKPPAALTRSVPTRVRPQLPRATRETLVCLAAAGVALLFGVGV